MASVIRFERPLTNKYDGSSGSPKNEVAMSAAVVEKDRQSGVQVDSSETLEQLQRRLIAEMLNMKVEEVSDDFLDEYLETHIYPQGRFDINSQYGGYDNSHLVVRTREEFESSAKSVAAARMRLKRDAGR